MTFPRYGSRRALAARPAGLASFLALLLAFLALPGPALAQALPEPPDGPPVSDSQVVDARTHDLASIMRCPVCQGLSVEESQADAALAMKARIRSLVEQGYSDEQIQDYFVDRYGVWVLLEPPATGMNLLVWVGPVVAFLLGALVLWLKLRGGSSGGDGPSPEPEGGEPSLDSAGRDSYRSRILQELEK